MQICTILIFYSLYIYNIRYLSDSLTVNSIIHICWTSVKCVSYYITINIDKYLRNNWSKRTYSPETWKILLERKIWNLLWNKVLSSVKTVMSTRSLNIKELYLLWAVFNSTGITHMEGNCANHFISIQGLPGVFPLTSKHFYILAPNICIPRKTLEFFGLENKAQDTQFSPPW